MTITKEQFETTGRKIDTKFTVAEKEFLRTKHTEIITDKENFAKTFNITAMLDVCKGKKSSLAMVAALGHDNEKIALLQAYLFDDPNEIDGLLGAKTMQKIQAYNQDELLASSRKQITKKNKNQENKQEKEKISYTLNQQDFDTYFKGQNFQQQYVGDCRILSVIDGLTKLSNYEMLIRTSVKLIKTGNDITYIITLPLGNKNGTTHKVTSTQISPQIGIDGKEIKLMSTQLNGLSALVHAFGQKETGQTNFDFHDLSGGRSTEVMNTLIKGIYVYGEYYNNGLGVSKVYKDIVGYRKNLTNILSLFNPEKHILTITVKQGEQTNEIKKIGYFNYGDHAVNVEKVHKNNDGIIQSIELSNPWDAGASYTINYPDCLEYINSYEIGSFDKIDGFSNKQRINRNKNRDQMHIKYEKTSTADSLNGIIQTTGRNKDQRISRSDVIVQHQGDKLSVQSWGKKDTYITYDTGSAHITIGNKKLSIETKKFANSFEGKVDNQFQSYLYPPRLSVFINKMRHNYITPQKGDQTNIKPFSLGGDGTLQFDDNPWKHTTNRAQTKRVTAEHITKDDTVTVLEKRSLLGITSTDTATKQKIIDFLNSLYNENSTKKQKT